MRLYQEMLASQVRERRRITLELAQIPGLFPVLMRRRNGQRWSPEDKALLLFHLHQLAGMSPYLIPAVMPGGILVLPILAWWLDRRRINRADEAAKSL